MPKRMTNQPSPAHSTSKCEQRLLQAFRRAATEVPAYATLLGEEGIVAEQIASVKDFVSRCPFLNKQNTFQRFPLNQLCVPGTLQDLAAVLTSSGQGGSFAFGLITRGQAESSPDMIDMVLDDAFGIATKRTLAINCLPMGVGFSSRRMTIATTSVREDMAMALATTFGPFYDQIVLVGDPLFLKRLTDYAQEQGIDWGQFRINVIIGEEIFGENYRDYLASCLQLNIDRPEAGFIMSSMGVGELGLHLFFETPETVSLRRTAHHNPAFCHALLNVDPNTTVSPMIFTYNPSRTFVEITDPNEAGYGALTVSLLEEEIPVPLLRYQTGDIGCLIKPEQVSKYCAQFDLPLPKTLYNPLIAILGRANESLPNGFHVGQYKDMLYYDRDLAQSFTGAFRLELEVDNSITLHVQLAKKQRVEQAMHSRILKTFPKLLRPERLKPWLYEQFPYGMTLDYERKFSYYRSR